MSKSRRSADSEADINTIETVAMLGSQFAFSTLMRRKQTDVRNPEIKRRSRLPRDRLLTNYYFQLTNYARRNHLCYTILLLYFFMRTFIEG